MRNTLGEEPFEELSGFRRECVRLVGNKYVQGKQVLDIGCGFGWCEWDLLGRGARRVVGLDLSSEVLRTARKIKNDRVSFKVGGATSIPFPDSSFDTVVSWEVLEHIPEGTEGRMFSEVYRVLKSGGHFFLSTPHKNVASTLLDPAWWLIGHRHYSKQAIEELALTNGFTVERLYTKGGIFTVLLTLNMYIAKWLFRRHMFFESFFWIKHNGEYKRAGGFVSVLLKCAK